MTVFLREPVDVTGLTEAGGTEGGSCASNGHRHRDRSTEMGYMKEIWTSAEAVEPGNAFEARDAARKLCEEWGSLNDTDLPVIAALILDAANMQDDGYDLRQSPWKITDHREVK